MEKNQKIIVFVSFVVMLILTIIALSSCEKENEKDFFIGEWSPRQDNEYTKIYDSLNNQVGVEQVYNKLCYDSIDSFTVSEGRTIIESDGEYYIKFNDSEPNCTLHLNINGNSLICDGSYFVENPGSASCSERKFTYSNISAEFKNDTLWEMGNYEDSSDGEIFNKGKYKAYFVKRMKTSTFISETK